MWQKRGLLIAPPTHLGWATSHAAVPHVDVRSDDEIWIYFTTRDEQRRSQVARARVRGDLVAENLMLDDRPLLVPLVRDGEIVGREPLAAARDRHRAAVAELPIAVQSMMRGEPAIPTLFE